MQVKERGGIFNWLAKFNIIAMKKQEAEGLMDRSGGCFVFWQSIPGTEVFSLSKPGLQRQNQNILI